MRKGGIHPRPFLQNGRGTLPQLIEGQLIGGVIMCYSTLKALVN